MLSRLILALALVASLPARAAQTHQTTHKPPPELDGIDVSRYQGDIDWRRVKKSGIAFAFIRMSDGTDNGDERFAANFRAAKKSRVMRGAYQYFRASQDPVAQADALVEAVRALGGAELPLVADVETSDDTDDATLRKNLLAWLARVEKRTHRKPILYLPPAMGNRLGARFSEWPLWIAHYDVEAPRLPDGWSAWRFWQRSQTGRVDGISGNVDLDRFAGSRSALRRLNRRIHAGP